MTAMKKTFQLFLLLAAAPGLRAQDIHFSQFYMSPLTMNPSLAGAEHDLQAVLNYKSQWQSVTNPYKTMGCSFDMRVKNSDAGILAAGANFFSDKAGDAAMGTTEGGLSLAYHARMNTYHTLGGGLQAGFAQRKIRYDALQWGNQYDGTSFNSAISSGEAAGMPSFTRMDLSCGITWNYNNTSGRKSVTNNHDQRFTLGLAAFHLNRPNYSFYGGSEKLFIRYVAHGKALISVPNSNVAFAPGFMYTRQGPAQEIYAGSLVRFLIGQDSKYTGFKQGAAVSFGGFLRAQDAVAAVVLLEFANYAMGFSYDINTSKLKTSSNARGGFEVSLRFVTPNPFGKGTSTSSF